MKTNLVCVVYCISDDFDQVFILLCKKKSEHKTLKSHIYTFKIKMLCLTPFSGNLFPLLVSFFCSRARAHDHR